MDVLSEIIESKRVRLSLSRETRSPESLRAAALAVRAKALPHALRRALEDEGRVNIIAEVKRASPSLGMIRADAEPAQIALEYEAGGAAAISVLTEEDRFRGSLEDLRAVRAAVNIPLLRKDFIFDEYQLYEAAEAGADALLLIVAALDDETLKRLRRLTEEELGMDALVEVHTVEEMRRAAACGASLIGVNNRNLRTFEVSLETSVELISAAPPAALCVSESGLRTPEDLRRLRALGYRGFLIGETLMRSPQPEAALKTLLQESKEGSKGVKG
ncbi:MAG TPA: indole-3-glycerol phosphate synthase TrpC [Pyrinomonadaceae bacterium]|jgi:indole-3-glycerol phosphate synthase